MTIRCIAFDLDDTLWACHPVIIRAESIFYAWLQEHYPRITAQHTEEELIKDRMRFAENNLDLHYNLTKLRKNWLHELATKAAYSPKEMVEPAFRVFWLARNEVRFFEGALPLLERLADQYLLGVISNGNADVHHIGIGHLFHFVQSAADAGAAKPDKRIFQQALHNTQLNPENVVYVGDDAQKDIIGAMDAGLRTIWFNPKGMAWNAHQQPDAIVNTLDEIDEAIITINTGS